ncbi:MAG: anthranilate synthase component I family protein [Thermoanaerobaculaceae bacterium]|jgi:para-aminobenzoate synthetase component 1|nr:anthranilate synthase component I family protein [Thermoanaerobaculaceae bacterium]
MCCTAITERWTARAARLGVEDLFSLPGREPFALLYGDGPGADWLLFAEGPLVVAEGLDLPELTFERMGEVPSIRPDWIGFASYEAGYALDPVLPLAPALPWRFPLVHLAVYRSLRLFHRPSGTLYEARREGIAAPREASLLRPGGFSARKTWDSDDGEAYAAKVTRIREEIRRGNVYQVDLTRQEAWSYEGSLLELARRLYAANPAPFSGLIAGTDFAVLSSSPERFVRFSGGRIESRPIKGTAARGSGPDADRLQAKRLLGSAKDLAELAMIVDLVRNDLARVCRWPSVRVEGFPGLETYANVHHLVATVAGELRPGLDLRALLTALFPAGSITGCPKLAAMACIRELEDHPRLAYTGALGWLSQGLDQAEVAVAIRTASAVAGELRFGVGGGVVWDSDPAAEYLETVHKGRSLVACLSS